ncbi:MAG: hypothetical protein ACLQBB_13285 [Solirubrobacteraceae bacterium]
MPEFDSNEDPTSLPAARPEGAAAHPEPGTSGGDGAPAARRGAPERPADFPAPPVRCDRDLTAPHRHARAAREGKRWWVASLTARREARRRACRAGVGAAAGAHARPPRGRTRCHRQLPGSTS